MLYAYHLKSSLLSSLFIPPLSSSTPFHPLPLAITILCCLWVIVFRVIWKEQDMYYRKNNRGVGDRKRKLHPMGEPKTNSQTSLREPLPHRGPVQRCADMIITQTLCLRRYTTSTNLHWTLDIELSNLCSTMQWEGTCFPVLRFQRLGSLCLQ